MSNRPTPQPSPALAGRFRVVGTEPGEVQTQTHGRVDLRTIDLATAEQLVATGYHCFLERIPEAAPEPDPAPAAPAPAQRRRAARTTRPAAE